MFACFVLLAVLPIVQPIKATSTEKVLSASSVTATIPQTEYTHHSAVKSNLEVLSKIENNLLSLLNIKRPSNIDRSKIIIPKALKKLYEDIANHDLISINIPRPGLLTKSANTVRSFTHQETKIDHRFPHHHRFRLYFNLKSLPQEEKLKAAELLLTRDVISHVTLDPHQAKRTRYQVLVYDITSVGIRGKRKPNHLLLDNKTIRLNSTDTVSFDVQPAVERWKAAPKQNHGLLVEIRSMHSQNPVHHHVRLRRSVGESFEDWQHKQPLLFTYTDDGRHKSHSIPEIQNRPKREESQSQPQSGRRRKTNDDCRRHSLYVDFSDIGWNNWIVSPSGFDAFYCHGSCPFSLSEHFNTTNHAVMQTLANNLNPANIPKPCCMPTQLGPLSMLYLDDQNVHVVKNYKDMIVLSCGCR